MKVLLTGASGFTGLNLFEKLSKTFSLLAPSHAELDLTDQDAVDAFFIDNKIDAVIHGAIKPMHRNAKDPSDLIRPNLLMYYNLERNVELLGIKMFFIGSGCCYNAEHYKPKMSEEYFGEYVPTSVEGIVKYTISSHILRSSQIYDLRVFGLFGKYEDYAIRFISNAICKALHRMPITLRQNRRFDYLYIDDLADILTEMLQLELRFRAYNITPDSSVTLLELAEMIKNETCDVPVIVGKNGMGAEYSGDNARFRGELPGFSFTNITDSLRELVLWYRNHLDAINKECLLADR
jgi:GDP-L-fucose synthase